MIGDRIAELRKDKGMTQEMLAEYLNVTRSSIGNYEKGVNEPSLQVVTKLCELFGVSADYLLGLSKHKYNINLEPTHTVDLIYKILDIFKGYKITKR